MAHERNDKKPVVSPFIFLALFIFLHLFFYYICMMSKTIAIIFLFIAGILSHSLQAQAYRTEVFSTRIQTLRVSVADKWELPPIIDLYAGDPVEISFDVLGASPEYLTYKILHCNADWTLSPLIEPEYMNGLQNNPLDDYNNSFNTRMDYVHYKLLVPNDNINLLVSGNYVVQVFSEVSELPILTACFSVVEPEANIEMKVSSVTDKGAIQNTKV